jgi:hypothetical protein
LGSIVIHLGSSPVGNSPAQAIDLALRALFAPVSLAPTVAAEVDGYCAPAALASRRRRS